MIGGLLFENLAMQTLPWLRRGLGGSKTRPHTVCGEIRLNLLRVETRPDYSSSLWAR